MIINFKIRGGRCLAAGRLNRFSYYLCIVIALLLAPKIVVAQPTPVYVVSHFAGASDGSRGSSDGKGSAARFNHPEGIGIDGAGNLLVVDSDNYTIRKIAPDGTTTTLAGAVGQFGTEDGAASAARFGQGMGGLAMDAAGNIYVAEWFSCTIRKITAEGVVTTLAGSPGQRGDVDGIGASARFSYPADVAVNGEGDVYVADWGNSKIRKITKTGLVTTLAGSVAGSKDGTGTSATFNSPYGLTVDSTGIIYVADSSNSTIRRITRDGNVTTIAGIPGNFGHSDGIGFSASLGIPVGIIGDVAGNLYVTEANVATVRKISPTRMVTTIAGTFDAHGDVDGQGAEARFGSLSYIAIDPSGNLYITDSQNNNIRKCTPVFLAMPSIVTQPASKTVFIGESVTFSVIATNALSYHWVKEGPDGATAISDGGPTMTISPAYVPHSGNYHVVVTGPGGTVQSVSFSLSVIDSSAQKSKLSNISTRAFVGAGGDVLIAGFIIGGTGQKTVLIRAAGPALAKFGVQDVLADPILTVFSGSAVIATNDNWGDDPVQKAANVQAFATSGGFSFDDNSKDSALVVTLSPGLYTAIVSGAGGTIGAALAEVYELDINNTSSRLTNISSRSLVKTGSNVQIAGFTIYGTGPKKVVIRASGPALRKYGVPGILSDPKIELHSLDKKLASNDDWGPEVLTDFQKLGIDNWEIGSKDSALVAMLPPGGYTVVVSGANDPGVALVEVYDEE